MNQPPDGVSPVEGVPAGHPLLLLTAGRVDPFDLEQRIGEPAA